MQGVTTLPNHMLYKLFVMAAEAGATAAFSKAGLQLSTMSKSEACRQYGRAKVERWIREGKIKKTKADKWEIDRNEIEILHKLTSNPSLNLIKSEI